MDSSYLDRQNFVPQLEEMITDSGNLDKETYKDLVAAIKEAHTFGIHQRKLSSSRENEIQSCIGGRGGGSTLSSHSSMSVICISAIGWWLHNKFFSICAV